MGGKEKNQQKKIIKKKFELKKLLFCWGFLRFTKVLKEWEDFLDASVILSQ